MLDLFFCNIKCQTKSKVPSLLQVPHRSFALAHPVAGCTGLSHTTEHTVILSRVSVDLHMRRPQMQKNTRLYKKNFVCTCAVHNVFHLSSVVPLSSSLTTIGASSGTSPLGADSVDALPGHLRSHNSKQTNN